MIDEYKNVKKCIGKGKQGSVHDTLHKQIVIKVIPKKKFNISEYKYAKKIAELGLAPEIYKKVTTKEHVLIYMHRIDYTLFDWIKKRRTKKEYNDVYEKVIKTINTLHENNIIHGDIHVGNIGVIKNKVVLIDFGFTHKKGTGSSQKLLSKKTKRLRKIPDSENNKGFEQYFKSILQPYDKLSILLKIHLWRIS